MLPTGRPSTPPPQQESEVMPPRTPSPQVAASASSTRPALVTPERYLNDLVIQHFPGNSGDMWHIMTTVPDGYKEKCESLQLGLATYKNILALELFPSKTKQGREKCEREYDSFHTKIYNALYSSTGIYYTVTTKDVEHLEIYAIHQAHSLIHEAKTGSHLSGVSHFNKTKSCLIYVESQQAILIKLLWICGKKLDKINVGAQRYKNLVEEFISYFESQITCLKASVLYYDLNFARNKAKNDSVTSDVGTSKTPVFIPMAPLSPIMRAWHSYKLQERTPLKHTTPCIKAIVEHPVDLSDKRPGVIAQSENRRELARKLLSDKRLGLANTTTTSPSTTTSSPLLLSTGLTPLFSRMAPLRQSFDSADSSPSKKLHLQPPPNHPSFS